MSFTVLRKRKAASDRNRLGTISQDLVLLEASLELMAWPWCPPEFRSWLYCCLAERWIQSNQLSLAPPSEHHRTSRAVRADGLSVSKIPLSKSCPERQPSCRRWEAQKCRGWLLSGDTAVRGRWQGRSLWRFRGLNWSLDRKSVV